MERLETLVEDLRMQLRRPVVLAEDLKQQVGQLEQQVEFLAAAYRVIAAVLRRV